MLPRGGKFPENVYSSYGDIVNQLLPGVGAST